MLCCPDWKMSFEMAHVRFVKQYEFQMIDYAGEILKQVGDMEERYEVIVIH